MYAEHSAGPGPELQELHLPSSLAVLPDLDLVARYVVAEAADGAGGGWFDAVPLGGEAVALVVGDVVGRDVPAIGVMSQVRSAVSAWLLTGASPAGALRSLDALAATTDGVTGASVCVVVLDRTSGRLRWATAGHRGPVVVTGEQPHRLAGHLASTTGGPVGTGADYADEEGVLGPGTVLLLASGSADRPGEPEADADGPLAAALAGALEQPLGAAAADASDAGRRGVLETTTNRLLDRLLTAESLPEDLAVLGVVRVAPPDPLALEVEAGPSAPRALRESLVAWLRDLGAGRWDTSVLRLAVAELAANAVQHGARDRAGATVALHADLDRTGVVEVRVTDSGTWRSPTPRAGGPEAATRGLATARGLVDALALRRGTAAEPGTVVTLRHRLRRDVPVYRAEVDQLTQAPDLSSRRDDAGVLHLSGSVDGDVAADLRSLLLAATCGGVVDATVDVGGLARLGREGLQVLAEARRWREADGGRLHLRAPAHSPAAWALETAGMAHC